MYNVIGNRFWSNCMHRQYQPFRKKFNFPKINNELVFIWIKAIICFSLFRLVFLNQFNVDRKIPTASVTKKNGAMKHKRLQVLDNNNWIKKFIDFRSQLMLVEQKMLSFFFERCLFSVYIPIYFCFDCAMSEQYCNIIVSDSPQKCHCSYTTCQPQNLSAAHKHAVAECILKRQHSENKIIV